MIRNTIEIELPDKRKVGFRTGMLAIGVACSKMKARSTEELFARIGSIDVHATIALYYGAAYDYNESKGKEVDFTMSDVADWIQEMGDENAKKVSDTLLESYLPKNYTPPENPGEVQL